MDDENQKSKSKEKEEEEAGGVAGGVLRGLGNLIPGLGGIVAGLEKSDAFQQRLSAINKEVERQLREAPLKKVEQEGGSRTIIPPSTAFRGGKAPSRAKAPPFNKQRDIIADIFDEGDYLKIIAELPGVTEQDIKTEVKGSLLTIAARGISREYYKELILPCPIIEELDSSYNNGIFQLKAEKILKGGEPK